MAKTPTIASANTVRDWAEAHNIEVSGRGRFSSDLIRAFNNDRENKRRGVYYEPQPRKEREPLGTPNDKPINSHPTRRETNRTHRAADESPNAQITVIPSEEIADSIPATVLEMLRAAGNAEGNQAVVTIHALVNI